MTQVQSDTYPGLTAYDRCDRCGAQAYVRVALYDELLFCAHHSAEYESALAMDGWRIVTDNRSALTPSRES